MGFAFVRRVRILLQTHRVFVRACMHGSLWKRYLENRDVWEVPAWSACCVYGPAKSIHSSSQPLNGKSAWWWRGCGWWQWWWWSSWWPKGTYIEICAFLTIWDQLIGGPTGCNFCRKKNLCFHIEQWLIFLLSISNSITTRRSRSKRWGLDVGMYRSLLLPIGLVPACVANGVLYLSLSCVVVLCCLFCVVLSMCMCCLVYVYVLCCLCACVLLSLCLF